MTSLTQQVEEQAPNPVGWMMCFLLMTFVAVQKLCVYIYIYMYIYIGPLYVTSSYSTWIFCRGVSGFATDCPCDVWCRGLTTCLLHVGPPFGNRFLNTSWAVGLTYWIIYLHFVCILTYAIIYVLIHHIIFWLYLYFLNIFYFFKDSCINIFHRRSLCAFYWKPVVFPNKGPIMGGLMFSLLLASCLVGAAEE